MRNTIKHKDLLGLIDVHGKKGEGGAVRLPPGVKGWWSHGTEHRGGEDKISINAAHPFKDAFSEADPKSQKLILDILQSFSHTRSRLSGQRYFDPDMLFYHLEHDWSNYLKDKLER